MPLAPLEALACGLPLVLTDIPGHQIFHRYSLMINPIENVNESSAKLESFFEQYSFQEKRAATGRAWVEKQFGLEGMVNRYVSLYLPQET